MPRIEREKDIKSERIQFRAKNASTRNSRTKDVPAKAISWLAKRLETDSIVALSRSKVTLALIIIGALGSFSASARDHNRQGSGW